jgi:type IV secretion system protein VirD4
MAGGFSPANAYWFLRSAPVPNLLFGPIAGLITVFALPMHRRRPVAMVSLICFLGVAGFYALREYARLSPSVESGSVTWDEVLSYLDFFAVIAAAVGFVIVAISARISVVVSDPVKRAKRGTFGDADWLHHVSAGAKLFPPGRRDRRRRTLSRRQGTRITRVPFDPADPSRHGEAAAPRRCSPISRTSIPPICCSLRAQADYKTTSNVVPTALRYTGPIDLPRSRRPKSLLWSSSIAGRNRCGARVHGPRPDKSE